MYLGAPLVGFFRGDARASLGKAIPGLLRSSFPCGGSRGFSPSKGEPSGSFGGDHAAQGGGDSQGGGRAFRDEPQQLPVGWGSPGQCLSDEGFETYLEHRIVERKWIAFHLKLFLPDQEVIIESAG